MLVALVLLWAGAGAREAAWSFENNPTGKISSRLAKCEKRVTAKAREIFEMAEDPADMPGYLESWCDHLGHKSFFNLEKEHSRVVKKFKTIWRKACALARSSQALLEDPRLFSAKRYCAALIQVVSVLAAKADKKPKRADFSRPMNLAPVAKSWSQVIAHAKRARHKKLRPCCHAHPYLGCVDTVISDCVCAKDPHCCSKSWDIKCSETVEKFSKYPDPVQGPTELQCGRCPREAAPVVKDRFISKKEL